MKTCRPVLSLLTILCVGSFALAEPAQTQPAPATQPATKPAMSRQMAPGMNMNMEEGESVVLKAYSINDDENKFAAYVVNWNGHEVVAIDPTGKSQFKAGDKVKFMVQRIKMTMKPQPETTMLMFMCLPEMQPKPIEATTAPN